jgi:hypothetical protein
MQLDIVPIPGYPHYFATKNGEIWGNRTGNGAVLGEPRRLQLLPCGDYTHVVICFAGMKPKRMLVHRLILLTFVGKCPPKCECDHINGDGHDNRLENLRWVTHSENCANMYSRAGGAPWRKGERSPNAKLHDLAVNEIRSLYNAGARQCDLARGYAVSASLISMVVRSLVRL